MYKDHKRLASSEEAEDIERRGKRNKFIIGYIFRRGTTLSQIASITFPGTENHNYLLDRENETRNSKGAFEDSFSFPPQIVCSVTKSFKTFSRSFVQFPRCLREHISLRPNWFMYVCTHQQHRCVRPGGFIYTFYMHTQSQRMSWPCKRWQPWQKKIAFIVHDDSNEL